MTTTQQLMLLEKNLSWGEILKLMTKIISIVDIFLPLGASERIKRRHQQLKDLLKEKDPYAIKWFFSEDMLCVIGGKDYLVCTDMYIKTTVDAIIQYRFNILDKCSDELWTCFLNGADHYREEKLRFILDEYMRVNA